MEIERLDLIRWGKFSGHTIRLKSGVNIIYGGNESGKSTIHSFLGAMLFGPRLKEEKGHQATGSAPDFTDGEGAMTVWDGGQHYEIYRTFAPYSGMLLMRQEVEAAEQLSDWEEIDEPQEVLSDLLGGMDAGTFESTVFWKQNQAAWELYVEDGLKQCLKAGKTGENADGAQAIQILEERRGKAEQKKKKEADALEERIRKRQLEAEYVRKEAGRLQAQCNALREGTRKEASEEEGEGNGFTETGKNLIQMLLLLAGVLALLGAFLLQNLLLRIFLGIFGGAFLLLFFPVRRLLLGESVPEDEEEYDFSAGEERLKAEIRKKEDTYQKLQEELEKLYHQHMKMETADTEIAALNLAIDRIRELSEEENSGPAGEIGDCASEIIKELGCTSCDRIAVETSGRIRAYLGGHITDRKKVSSSALQQIRFAVRMAAGEVLADGEELPFLLDEPFAMYDDGRLRGVLSWLERSGHQVVLFTCQQRVRQIMDEVRREIRQVNGKNGQMPENVRMYDEDSGRKVK